MRWPVSRVTFWNIGPAHRAAKTKKRAFDKKLLYPDMRGTQGEGVPVVFRIRKRTSPAGQLKRGNKMEKKYWSLKNKVAVTLLLAGFACGVGLLAAARSILPVAVLGWVGLAVVACFVMLCFTVFSVNEKETAAYFKALLDMGQYATLLGSYLVLAIALAVL